MGSATATAIAAPKQVAQGGIVPCLEERAIRSTAPAHSASDNTEVAALGNLATGFSECGGPSAGSRTPCNPNQCPAGSARCAQTSCVGAACGHAADTAGADAAGRNKSGKKMSCRCETCSGNGSGKISLMGQTFE